MFVVKTALSSVEDELSSYAASLWPLSTMTEVKENKMVLADVAFEGLFKDVEASFDRQHVFNVIYL